MSGKGIGGKPGIGSGSGSGGGLGIWAWIITGGALNLFYPVFERHSVNDLGEMVWPVEPALFLPGAQQELEHHGMHCLARQPANLKPGYSIRLSTEFTPAEIECLHLAIVGTGVSVLSHLNAMPLAQTDQRKGSGSV